MRLKTGMSVRVISGNHKGKEGKILRVIKDRERVIIEGVNLIKKTYATYSRESKRWNY